MSKKDHWGCYQKVQKPAFVEGQAAGLYWGGGKNRNHWWPQAPNCGKIFLFKKVLLTYIEQKYYIHTFKYVWIQNAQHY